MALTNEDIAIDLGNLSSPIELGCLYERPQPVELEIGSGKGTFLLNRAKSHPEMNFLGIEWANKYYRYSVDRMRRWGVSNVRMVRADARDFMRRFLVDECLSVCHIYFPDPWPKRRHQKRRFFLPPNIRHVVRCLAPGGELRIATDHAEYFQVISEVLLGQPEVAALFEQVDFYPAETANAGEWIGSNFERKYVKEGRKIFTLALKKIQV